MGYEVIRFPYDGAIDADGHVLEPAWLWEEYLEERFRPRALRVRTDERGLEYLELDGRPSERTKNGVLGLMGAMGDPDAQARSRPALHGPHPVTAPAARPSASSCSTTSISRRASSIRPSASCGSASSPTRSSPSPTCAPTTAGSRTSAARAAAGWCRSRSSRCSTPRRRRRSSNVPSGMGAAERSSRRSPTRRTAHGHSDHDVLFAKACELDVPLGIHPTYEPGWATPVRFKGLGRAAEFFYNVMLRQGVQQAFLSFFALGTLDRFPALRLGVLEAGSGWIGAFLDRMDAVSRHHLGDRRRAQR